MCAQMVIPKGTGTDTDTQLRSLIRRVMGASRVSTPPQINSPALARVLLESRRADAELRSNPTYSSGESFKAVPRDGTLSSLFVIVKISDDGNFVKCTVNIPKGDMHACPAGWTSEDSFHTLSHEIDVRGKDTGDVSKMANIIAHAVRLLLEDNNTNNLIPFNPARSRPVKISRAIKGLEDDMLTMMHYAVEHIYDVVRGSPIICHSSRALIEKSLRP